MKTVIVYYSLEGNTHYIAEKIAEKLGADTLRLRTKKAYADKGFAKFFWGGKSAVMAEKPELEPFDTDIASYDRIIIGFPVWASNITPPIRSFISECAADLKGKKIAVFACESGSGAPKAFEKLKKALGSADYEAEAVFIDPKDRPSEKNSEVLDDFCGRLV
ncbi:MAG: NAD(P)H-dependent oxidoreductase [Clostridia bacterium]|nr:NAD(P)H-dependent oxidoreductase [Clostridia bacterium]